jgi:DNA (cytosine-5)-methyltransferase 1
MDSSQKLKVFELFAGIGGFSLGFEATDIFETVGFCEIDPFCQKVLAKHWPGVWQHDDIRTLTAESIQRNCGRIDVLTGGFPCQPHSLAGERQASNDERDLWPEYRRIICELKPKWVVAENVVGLLSSESGRFFAGILRDLAQIGYDAEWQVLSAATFGAPHLRERIIVVAYPREKRFSRSIFEWKSLCVTEGSSSTVFGNRIIPSGDWWTKHGRDIYVEHGFSGGLVRKIISACGNAIVPQMAQYVAECIASA